METQNPKDGKAKNVKKERDRNIGKAAVKGQAFTPWKGFWCCV